MPLISERSATLSSYVRFNVKIYQPSDFARDRTATIRACAKYAHALHYRMSDQAMITIFKHVNLPFHNTLLSFLHQAFSQPFYCTKAFFSQADSYAWFC